MSTEQLRADFEAHFSRPPFEWEFHRYGEDSAWPGNYQLYEHQCAWEAYQAGRAALQSQTVNEGWKEAAVAWEVCASLHREYCKGKDPLFKTRQADLVRHADDARKRFSESDAPQTQLQADPSEWIKQHEALMHRVSKAALVVGYGGTINGTAAEQALENAEKALLDHALALQSQDREDAERYRLLRRGQRWSVIDGIGATLRAEALDAAIDRVRRVEGRGNE